MRYLKILFGLVSIISTLYLAHFIFSIFYLDVYQYYQGEGFEKEFVFFFSFFIEFLLLGAMIFILLSLYKLIKSGFFQIKAKNNFVIGGYIFLLAGLLDFVYCINVINESNDIGNYFQRFATNFLLMILGLVILAISKFVSEGFLLKEENNLTI